MKMAVVIADDHEILRDALATQIAKRAGLHVVASVGDAQSAVNACRQHQPDLLLLDIEMPGRDSLAAMSDIRAASPNTRIVILSAYCRDSFIGIACDNGAVGYLLKSDPPATIVNSLEKIATGGTGVYSKSVQQRVSLREVKTGYAERRATRVDDLTPRELEVLRYIGRGMDNDAMAKTMSLSKRTVERHVARLMDVVAIRERAGLMKLAYESGLAG